MGRNPFYLGLWFCGRSPMTNYQRGCGSAALAATLLTHAWLPVNMTTAEGAGILDVFEHETLMKEPVYPTCR